MRPARTLLMLVGAVATLLACLFLLASVGIGDAAEPPAHATASAVARAPDGPEQRLARLPCFGCHNLEHYRKGKPALANAPAATATDDDEGEAEGEDGPPKGEFSHTLHAQEGVGHCHVCHALTGHFHVTMRKETCEACH